MHDMHAGLFYAANVERVRIDKLHDDDTEDIFISQVIGNQDFRQAAE